MKKIFTKIAIVLSALTFPFAMTSCDEELTNSIFEIITNILSGQGVQYKFTGTASDAYALLSNTGSTSDFVFVGGTKKAESFNLVLPVKIGQTASIEFPETTVNGITFPATVISNLTATATSDNSAITISAGDNVSGSGTLKVGGEEYPLYNVIIDGLTFQTNASTGASTLKGNQIQLWYGKESGKLYVLNFNYSGTGTGNSASH